jgi:hypothetical protein
LKKILSITIVHLLIITSNFASISFAAEKTLPNEDIGITREKPVGNYCGPDDTTPDSVNGISKNFIEVPSKSYSVHVQGKDDANVKLFDRWSFISERRACSIPFTVEEYYNRSNSVVTYTFTSKATKSTTYSASVNSNFTKAFSTSMGYSAQTTVERTSSFSVRVKPGKSVRLDASASLALIEGTWHYLTGSKDITVYYPTYIIWLTH